MFRKAGIGIALMALAAATLARPATAASPRMEATVHDFTTFDPIDGASATLTRTRSGLTATFKTTLPAGHAETLWWVIFNDPSGCTVGADGCGDDEILTAFAGGPNPAAVTIQNADGRVVPPTGRTTFAARLNVGSDGPGEVLLPGGISDPMGALVLLVVVDHGPASSDPETRRLQTHALLAPGACPNQTAEDPFGDCFDAQIAVFPPA